jgi:hypothetical protein
MYAFFYFLDGSHHNLLSKSLQMTHYIFTWLRCKIKLNIFHFTYILWLASQVNNVGGSTRQLNLYIR